MKPDPYRIVCFVGPINRLVAGPSALTTKVRTFLADTPSGVTPRWGAMAAAKPSVSTSPELPGVTSSSQNAVTI